MTPFPTSLPFSPFDAFAAALNPVQFALRQQMNGLDQMIYGHQGLSPTELRQLAKAGGRGGGIWVVAPGEGLAYFEDLPEFRAAPGRAVTRFSVAGGGGSDLGAVALARRLADHYGEPVAGIVAGYSARDALGDVMGGVAGLNAANLGLHIHHLARRELEAIEPNPAQVAQTPRAEAREHASLRAASGTLVELLQEPDRTIASVAGHSKGALAISFALDALMLSGDMATLKRVCRIDLLSIGVLLTVPPVIQNLTQVMGEYDAFGGVNSDLSNPHHMVSGAGHHLNTDLPCALDLAAFLRDQQI
ncbi:hypothetical protein GFB49_10860 [Epibacterium sp. SM1979]|uniref:Uncharacterized protein n=1 Tax=Tritonibacter litoralis TaxID=2662264 RepID=A0A843YH12_9RHOB|nr:hypothetical protein [Tritonibacter litoralis]MQQ08955.1 hypothetical protein [Tritonibacter litoralis]